MIMMSEFARVLGEIIDYGKREKLFSIKELAQQAQITPSYLSNLKQSNRKPPAHKTLIKLTDALRALKMPETEVMRLIEAFNRQHLSHQDEGKLLESLIDDYKERGNLFERLKQGVQTKGLVLKKRTETRTSLEQKILRSEFLEGDHHAFILKAITLLEKAQEIAERGGSIYITWFHHDLHDEEFNRDREELRSMLRRFLWADSPFQVFHLWAGDIAREMTVILDFLEIYIGTSHCFLYEIPYGEHLPEYLVIEGVGFIEAKPISENYYWIRDVLVDDENSPQAAELHGLIQYLEHLLGPADQRKPLVKTNAPSQSFSITPVTRKLADVEEENLRTELLLIKSSLSARFRPIEYVRALLEASSLAPEQFEMYVNHHIERATTQQRRFEQGKGRSIHEREFLKNDFQKILPALTGVPLEEQTPQMLEANLLKGQILGVLRMLKENPNIHFALAEQEYLIRFSLSGNTAFLSFDPPGTEHESPFKRDDALVRAWTEHPDVIYQLRHEFNMIWKNIDPQWRTDTEQGRHQIINFFVAEPLKVLLDATIPVEDIAGLLCELLTYAVFLDSESFIREVYTYEQGANEILILSNDLPSITMPADIGPWGPRSSVRTRQILFHALLRDIENVHVITPQAQLAAYWENGSYEAETFSREWVARHVRHLHQLLLKYPKKIELNILPELARFPVNIEVINRKYVFLQRAQNCWEQGGLVLHDPELAQKLLAYIDRTLVSPCPEALKNADSLTTWLPAPRKPQT